MLLWVYPGTNCSTKPFWLFYTSISKTAVETTCANGCGAGAAHFRGLGFEFLQAGRAILFGTCQAVGNL